MTLRRSPVWPAATVALTALTVVTAISCRRVFVDWDFLPLLLTVAIGVHLLMALGRMFDIPLLVVTPIAALLTAAVIGREMYPSTLRAGFLPTRTTWNTAWLDLRDAWRQFDTASAPVPSTGGFLLAAALAIGVAAFAADTFGFRAFGRVEAVIPAGVVYTFVAALGVQDENGGIDYARIWSGAVWLFTACVCVALLRAAHGDIGSTWLGGRRRERTARIALAAGTLSLVTVAAAFVVAPRLPGAGETALIDPGSGGSSDVTVLSPIVDIRARLVERSNRVMFTVDAERPAYWHLSSLVQFTGDTWAPAEDFSDVAGELGADPPAGGTELDHTVEIENMGGTWLPTALEPVAVDSPDELVYSPASSTLRRTEDRNIYAGMTYRVSSVLPEYTAAELRRATTDTPPDQIYLQLPEDFPDSLRDLADEVTAGATTPFDQAIALQDWFWDEFEYSTNVPAGHSESAMETFVNQKIGYCEQFAGTFAALGRSLGLPTRVAVGFTPGVEDDGRFVVRGRNAHAWPEVWFDDYGWVAFEPTPGRGAPGAEQYTGHVPAQDEQVGPDTPAGDRTPSDRETATPTVPRETAPASGGTPGAELPGLGPTAAETDVPPATDSGSFPVALLIAALAVGLLLAWLYLVPRVVAYRARRRRGHTAADRVANAYLEADRALDLIGVGRTESETPLEHAARVWKQTGFDRDSMRWLANAATRAVYAGDTLDEATAHESERIRNEVSDWVRSRAGWATRMRAHLDPRIAAALH